MQENTLYFEDNNRKIDFILTYTEEARDKKNADDHDKRMDKREAFLKKFDECGLEYEVQDCSVSYRKM